MKCKKYKQIGPLVQSLIGHIKEFITDYVQKQDLVPKNVQPDSQRLCDKSQENETIKPKGNSEEMITDFRQPEPETKEVESKDQKTQKTKEEEVLEACEELRVLTTEKYLNQEEIEEHVSNLGRKFTEVVDELLISHITVILVITSQ